LNPLDSSRKNLLEARGVSFHTSPGKKLVQAMSFTVEPGQRVAIVGPNGAGKSTLLRMLAGLLVPTSGHVLIGGTPLNDMTALAKARLIALLSQANQADIRLSVQEYVGLGCLPHRLAQSPSGLRAVVAEALALCNLTRYRDRAMGSLSGGECQRTHLARAIAQRPQILLLDEPTNHLDPRATLDLLSIVRSLGISVVAVLHNLSLVADWADQVAVLQTGALVRYDSPAQALNPVTVHKVFAMHSYYLPHPDRAQPILVLDSQAPNAKSPNEPHQRNHFFNHDEEHFT
jgi:iron complex transport system ATP-binding protein